MPARKVGTEGDLLRGLLAHPDEDTYRLVYADWLEENGHAERAEFVRVQCALARCAGDDPQRFALTERERELYPAQSAALVAELPKVAQSGIRFTLRRGFIEEMRTTAARFLKCVSGLFARHPLRFAEFDTFDAPALAECAGLSRLHGLGARNVRRSAFETLLASPHLTGLKELRADFYEGWPYSCHTKPFLALLDGPACAGVTHLAVSGIWGTDNIGRLAAAPRFAALTAFGITEEFTAGGARAFAQSPHISNLTALTLHNHRGTSPGALAELASSPFLSKLTSLTIDAGRIPVADIEVLAASPHLGNLTDLSLGAARPTKACWERLLRSSRLPRLTRVHIRDGDYTVPRAMGLRVGSAEGTLYAWVPR